MKKIYMLSWVLVLSVMGSTLMAQNGCPSGNPPAVKNFSYFINGQQYCTVFIENTWPNAQVILYGPGLTVIPSNSGQQVTTDANGFASYSFPCNQTPVRIVACNGTFCCTSLVPAAAILPVRLTKFEGQLQNDQTVSLNWTSAAEINSEAYIVERSVDGRNFEAVGTISAAGNSAKTLSYSFTDKLPVAGGYFYRLNQVDIDGKFEYSKVVYINSGKGKSAVTAVFPNPFRQEVQLVGINAADLNARNVRLFTIAGQQVNYRITGSNAISIDASSPKGIYFLKVKDKTFKLIKE